MLFLLVPLVQQTYPFVKTKPLAGAFVVPDKPELNGKSWWSGSFQQEYNAYYEFEVGLRPFLVRLRNQLFYWSFHQSTTFVTPGTSSQFYSWDYWAAYRGLDFRGLEKVREEVNLLVSLNESLIARNKKLLCVIAPNKVRYMPEFLPERLSKQSSDLTNYESYSRLIAEAGIPFLDLNNEFLEYKDTVLKPLFSNTSTHWSGYGMHLGISALIDQLESLGQQDLKNMRYAEWVMKDSCIDSDRDMIDLMNLLYPPSTEALAFPVYDLDTTGRAEPVKVLIIGDSFFWNFYAFNVRKEIFHPDSRFLYYNKSQMDMDGNRSAFNEADLPAILDKVDYVVILATEANLDKFPYGFPQSYFRGLN